MKKVSILFIVFVLLINNVSAQIEDAWVYLTDKENVSASLANPISILTQKAIDRKNAHNVTIDERDVPVNEAYIAQLKNTAGITVLAKSKWFNAVHVRGIQTNIEALTGLSFVSRIDFADKSLNAKNTVVTKKQNKQFKLESAITTFDYGNSANQIEMFNGHVLHLADYTGSGMTVAILDAGFPNVNTMAAFQRLRDAGNLLGSYDFVNRDVNVYTGTSSNHGTLVLSNMAGYIENEFVGTAPDASYYLFITEDSANENPVEESYWVEAAERADSLGVDILNTSLGYKDYAPNYTRYTHADTDLDGYTTYITRGANIAFEKGLLMVTSAGNSGNDGVGAPADSPNVLSIGAVNSSGDYVSFSSVGSAIQPTQKPDVVAQGLASVVVTENDVIGTSNGTSFSSPIIAGGITCLWQALPEKTNEEIMQLVRESASQYNTPDYFLGYGIPNLELALNSALTVKENGVNNAFKIYPNPVYNKLFFELPSEDTTVSVKLYDVLGQEVNSFQITYYQNEINTTALANGIYFIRVESSFISKTFKIIKH
ncbi:S8 family serine peptidase [Algibacter pectinivorans]|uniref:Por secretion system C-terminal sorting domain-containing protein n=1 Tax=Algibacter pectinivorans TaxID=870482 RepID=A0A1I1P1L5_9FLAO|nr:S8 family serine peptidase [Algibacter pectinivorans]SFD03556.1 Por secretion system C-terminal sorting domain-containing protein [Algibacter pectinivorans]